MKWVKDHDPNKDGDYIVIKGHSDLEVNTLSYTVAGGWNTHYTTDGKLYDENAFDDHVGEEGSWIKGWLTLSDGDPWRTDKPTEDGHYIVAMSYINTRMSFSTEHGWNALYKPENKIDDDYILGWMNIETVKEAFA
jgi:hypothetical protein